MSRKKPNFKTRRGNLTFSVSHSFMKTKDYQTVNPLGPQATQNWRRKMNYVLINTAAVTKTSQGLLMRVVFKY